MFSLEFAGSAFPGRQQHACTHTGTASPGLECAVRSHPQLGHNRKTVGVRSLGQQLDSGREASSLSTGKKLVHVGHPELRSRAVGIRGTTPSPSPPLFQGTCLVLVWKKS